MSSSTGGDDHLHGGRLRVPRSRGAVSGVLLILLGAWGALVPFLGPYAHFGYTPDRTWVWTGARFWLEVLPGAAVVLGGLLLLLGSDRITTSIGGWLAAAGGAWFVVGPALAGLLHLGAIGGPISTSTSGRAVQTLALFSGLGTVILLLSAAALGRLTVVGVRDVRAAQRRAKQERADAERQRAEAERARRQAELDGRAAESSAGRTISAPTSSPETIVTRDPGPGRSPAPPSRPEDNPGRSGSTQRE